MPANKGRVEQTGGTQGHEAPVRLATLFWRVIGRTCAEGLAPRLRLFAVFWPAAALRASAVKCIAALSSI